MKKIINITLLLIVFTSAFLFFLKSSDCLALNLKDAFQTSGQGNNDPLDKAASTAGYDTKNTTIEPIIGIIIKSALTFLGVIFLILTIYGGYMWMTAAGNEEQVGRAKKTLTTAVIGLIIVVSAYAISYFVIEKLGEATLEEAATPPTT